MRNLISFFVLFCLSFAATAQTCNPTVSAYPIGDGFSYQLYATSDSSGFFGNPVAWNWTFNPGGGSSTEQYPIAEFNAFGTYQLCVTVTMSSGCVGTGCTTVTIAPAAACSASFTTTTDPASGTITAVSTSTATDGSISSYSWFGGGMSYGTGNTATIGLGSSDSLYLCLTINTSNGCSNTYCETLFSNPSSECNATFNATLTDNVITGYYTGGAPMDAYAWTVTDGVQTYTASGTSLNFTLWDDVLPEVLVLLDNTLGSSSCGTSQFFFTNIDTTVVDCQAYFTYQTLGSNAYFVNNSTAAPGTFIMPNWTFGDGATSNEQNPVHIYASEGNYDVCLTIVIMLDPLTGENCINTYCQTVTVDSGGTCSNSFTYTNAELVATFAANTGGAAAINTWDFGDGMVATATNGSISHAYAVNGYYTVCLSSLFNDGCTAYSCDSLYINGGGGLLETTLCGNLYPASADSTDALNMYGATVYLIQHDAIAGTLTAVAQQDVFSNPGGGVLSYCFDGLAVGNEYLVKAALLPESPFYATYLPTYSINSITWSAATPIVLGDFAPNWAYIQFVEGVNLGGVGFIGGNISDGAGKTESVGLEGIEVILYNTTHQAVAVTYTDVNGNYSFNNLAFGIYYVAVEALNYSTDEITVVLSGSNVSSAANSFVQAANTFEAQASGIEANNVLLNSLNIMPNIANANSTVVIRSSKNTLTQVNVYDITSKLVASQNGNATQISLSTANMTAGMYLCHVVDANGNTATCKLIVQ